MPADSSYYLQFLHFIFAMRKFKEFTEDMYFYHIRLDQNKQINLWHSIVQRSSTKLMCLFIHGMVNRIENSIKYLQKDTSPLQQQPEMKRYLQIQHIVPLKSSLSILFNCSPQERNLYILISTAKRISYIHVFFKRAAKVLLKECRDDSYIKEKVK